MTPEWVHPGLVLILGAWLLPLLKGPLKRAARATPEPSGNNHRACFNVLAYSLFWVFKLKQSAFIKNTCWRSPLALFWVKVFKNCSRLPLNNDWSIICSAADSV